MGDRTDAKPDPMRPAWYFAETLPARVPRCTACGRPALSRPNRTSSIAIDGYESDRCKVSFQHRDCATAPIEAPIRVTSDWRMSRVLHHDGVRYIITAVAFVPASDSVPPHWRVLGVPEPDICATVAAPDRGPEAPKSPENR
jgi:hypothetical protein